MKELTLLYLRKNGQVLLAMKKRGFGAGKWNGVGGKVEAGETVRQAAIRECQEEIGVTPHELTKVGDAIFTITNHAEDSHHANIFVADAWDGEPHETEEMRPQWFAENELPYADMWANDGLWLPPLLAGKKFLGSFTLDGDEVIEHDIKEVNHFEEQP